MIRVCIADDHALVRGGFRYLLEPLGDMAVVCEVEQGEDIIAAVESGRPDVLTLDVTMPGMNFLEILGILSDRYPRVRVLVVSMHAEATYARRALQAGAAGYITKGRADIELLEAVRTIASGRRYVSATLAQDLAGELGVGAAASPHQSLTDRELQVMLLLAAGHTVTSIAEQLGRSVKTISTHRTRLLYKMALGSNADLVRYALAHQLIN